MGAVSLVAASRATGGTVIAAPHAGQRILRPAARASVLNTYRQPGQENSMLTLRLLPGAKVRHRQVRA